MSCKYALEINRLKIVLESTERPIVESLSFEVPAGKTVALVGESGSGKTMTSMAVMGLLPAGIRQVEGSISIDGQNVSELSAEQYRQLRNTKVSIVMQNPMSAFDPVMNIYRHFVETLASHDLTNRKEIRAKATEALSEVGFSDPRTILELYPFQMSGGMLQRVMLAIALISVPPIVIADEATSDLDVLSQARILRILKDHCRKNRLALLLITHDLSVAAGLADEMVLMKDGGLVEKSSVGEFFRNPQTPYAQRLLELHRGLYTPRYLKIMDNLVAGGGAQ